MENIMNSAGEVAVSILKVKDLRIGKTYFVTSDNFEKWLNEYKYKTFLLEE